MPGLTGCGLAEYGDSYTLSNTSATLSQTLKPKANVIRLAMPKNSDHTQLGADSRQQNAKQFTEKYENTGRAGNWLIDRFFRSAQGLIEPALPAKARVLEIGCGPGYSTARIKKWQGVDHLCAGEPDPQLLEIAREMNPNIELLNESAYHLSHADNTFDAVIMLEVLEHLDDPAKALAELRRVSRGVVLVSTPREPLWRILNCARGKYLGSLGNTPGHIQHWSSRGLTRQVSSHFKLVACAKPVPWTILLLRPRRA